MYTNLNRKYNIRLENMRSATELWRRQKGPFCKGLSGDYGFNLLDVYKRKFGEKYHIDV